MADAGDSSSLPPRLTELVELDQDARSALVEAVSARGFEPGCWVRLDDADLVADPNQLLEIMTRAAGLEPIAIGQFEEFNGEHPWDPPADGGDAWVILSQSCDLVRDVRDEPLVQLALLRQAPPELQLPPLWRTSSRWIPLDPTGRASRYYVDLRVQTFAPKSLIAQQDVRQAIPGDADFAKQRPRTRFCKRVGDRYSRMGIPTSVVEGVVNPIKKAVGAKNALRRQLDEAFSEWILMPPSSDGGPLVLFAVTVHETGSEPFMAAEDLFVNVFLEALPGEVRELLDADACAVVALDDLLVTVWTAGWKLDLDFLTYGSKGASSSPEPL